MDLAQLERAFDVFGAMDPGTLPFHHAQVFLFIAQQESCTYRGDRAAVCHHQRVSVPMRERPERLRQNTKRKRWA